MVIWIVLFIGIFFLLVLWKLEEIFGVLFRIKHLLIAIYNKIGVKKAPLGEWKPISYEDNSEWYCKESMIAHACGGNVRMVYTNSKEALMQALHDGFHVIEVDVKLSEDKELVCAHNFPMQTKMTREEFLATKIDKRYSAMDISECFTIVKESGVTCVIDTKNRIELPDVVAGVERICKEKNVSKDKIVIQIASEEEMTLTKDFQVLYNLTFTEDYERVTGFCLMHDIRVVSMSKSSIEKSAEWRILLEHNIKVYVHTINSLVEYERLRELGVAGVFTDFLINSDIDKVEN